MVAIAFIAFYSVFGDITDRIEAMKIPKYPDATWWDITDSSGIPDGSPNANIHFTTQSSQNDVITYYREILTKNGWSIGQEGNLVDINSKPKPDTYVIGFKKQGFSLELSHSYTWEFSISHSR